MQVIQVILCGSTNWKSLHIYIQQLWTSQNLWGNNNNEYEPDINDIISKLPTARVNSGTARNLNFIFPVKTVKFDVC